MPPKKRVAASESEEPSVPKRPRSSRIAAASVAKSNADDDVPVSKGTKIDAKKEVKNEKEVKGEIKKEDDGKLVVEKKEVVPKKEKEKEIKKDAGAKKKVAVNAGVDVISESKDLIENLYPNATVEIATKQRPFSFEIVAHVGGKDTVIWTGIEKKPRDAKFPPESELVELLKVGVKV
ncbi:hypothetical protein HDU76_009774 [Blyttiomyces sp. JEL0837]|nr:hypothetical protein HDU76_009774 [Blyttiomyces sp. JEL0837]